MEVNKAVGIDLGTTNSCVGIMDETDSDVILYSDRYGVNTTPSCVWHDPKRNLLVVGREAFLRRSADSPSITSIKRKMGTMLLTPLGWVARPPENLPERLARVLFETREQRLDRYLARIEDSDPERRAAKLARAGAEPPELWVFDQAARREAFLPTVTDVGLRERFQADPPLLWLPEEISALILIEERRQIAELLASRGGHSHRVERAVITVPAYFGARQVEATREAGMLAGLRVLELLQEPTAAARYYCWKHQIQDGVFLVFDLGGGTFDVSVVRRMSGVFDTLGISGNNFLGGDDMDARLAEWIRRNVAEESSDYDLRLEPDNSRDAIIRGRFIHLAEGVKKSLTNDPVCLLRDSTTVRDRQDRKVEIEMQIERECFENLVADVLAQCVPKCWEALAKAKQKANVSLRDVDHIFLAGGSTHSPVVQKLVREHFCPQAHKAAVDSRTMEAIVEQIQGDDQRQTDELRRLAREMIAGGERARCEQPFKDKPDLCVALGAAISAAAHGVPTRGESGGVVLEFSGPRGTRDNDIGIRGRVIAPAGTPLDGATVQVVSQPPGVVLRAPLEADAAFLVKRVPLRERTHNRFQVTVHSRTDEVMGRAELVIEQNPQYVEVTSGLDSCATLSKAIYIDVVRQGRVMKLPLIESGAALTGGLERRRQLKVPDPNTGMLRFRLYQARRPLADIVDTIDPTIAPDTPIIFTIAISEDQFMRAHYTVANSATRSFVIEPPPPESAPKPGEVRARIQQIEDALSYQSPVRQQILRARLLKINTQIEQARADGDDPKLIDLFHELEEFLREAGQPVAQLSPPWTEYESLLEKCRRVAGEIQNKKPDFPVASVRETLDAEGRAARAAFTAADQQLYSERWERLRELHAGLLREVEPPSDQGVLRASPAERAHQYVEKLKSTVKELERAAVHFAKQFDQRALQPPAGEKPEANRSHAEQCRCCSQELAACQVSVGRLAAQCLASPDSVIGECQSHEALVESWRTVLLVKQEILKGQRASHVDYGIPESDEAAPPI